MLGKFLDPKNDVAFKKIFGTEKNKDILIHFLNDMIIFNDGGKIQNVSFLPTTQDPDVAVYKSSIVDILCKDDQGRSYIVEMQVAKEKGFEKRAQYYASKSYASQLFVGGEYHTLKAVIFLAIADYTVFRDKTSYKSDHVILDRESYEHNLQDFSFTFLELSKFTKTLEELSSMVDKWAYFFKHAEETTVEDLKKIINHDEIIGRAYHELDRFYWNEVELRTYDQREKYEGAYLASMAQKFEEGEKKALLTVAKNMIRQGIDGKMISSVTGLSPREIESLMNSELE